MISFLLLAACVLMSALASAFLKLGVSDLSKSFTVLGLLSNWAIWLGGVCYAASFLGYIYTLRIVPLSLAQPVITAGVTALTAIVAVIFFKEQLQWQHWLGLILIGEGIFCLFYGRA